MASRVKSIRVAPEEIDRLNRLKRYFPEADTEAKLLRLALLYGIAILEAQVAAAGGDLHPAISVDTARTMARRILDAVALWLEAPGRGVANAPALPAEQPIANLDLDAAEDLEQLGSRIL